MKYTLLFIILIYCTCAIGQTVDTAFVKNQIDSLIKVSRELTNNKNFEEALEVHNIAASTVVDKFGKETAEYGSICFNYGRIMAHIKNYSEAEKGYLDSKVIREKVLGKMHLDYAWSLNNLALLYKVMNKYNEAEVLFLESKVIREKVLGKMHLDYAWSLDNLASLYFVMNKYNETEALLLESKVIREKILGKMHLDYALSLNNLGLLYSKYSHSEKGVLIYIELVNIREKLFGKIHPEYCGSLVNLAIQYYRQYKFMEAEKLLLEAKFIFESELKNTKHPAYFICLNALALVYDNQGYYEKTEAIQIQNLASIKSTSEDDYNSYVISLGNLAALYLKMGKYEKAEKLLLEVNQVFENKSDTNNFYYAQNLFNLASLYKNLNILDKAEKLAIESMAIKKKIFGNENVEIITNLSLLGIIYSELEKFEKAESFSKDAMNIIEKFGDKKGEKYYWILNNMAVIYGKIKNHQKAQTLLFECLKLTDSLNNDKGYKKALCLSNLSFLDIELKNYIKAEAQLIESINLMRNEFEYDSRVFTQVLLSLASLYLLMGEFDKATPLVLEVSNINKTRILNSKNHLSENELSNFIQKIKGSNDILLSLASLSNEKGLIHACFDNSLFFKGFLLSSALKIKNLAGTDTTLNEIFNQLKAYERRLVTQYTLTKSQRKGVEELEILINNLEKELAYSITGYKIVKQQVNPHEIEQILKDDEAAIEFVKYNFYRGEVTDSTMYAALILKKGYKEPLFIPLFEEKSIDSLLKVNIERNSDFVNHLYSFADRGIRPIDYQQRSLYDLIWSPIEKHLKGAKRIYYSPAGLLHRINLDAIPISDPMGIGSEAVGDHYQLIAMNSTRQLVIPALTNMNNQDVILYGGINYEPDSTYLDPTPVIASRSRGELSFNFVDSTLRGGNWNYLPGTEREIQALEELLKSKSLKVTTKKGSAATEESFKNIGLQSNSPRVLHISTHGYFFPDPDRAVSAKSGVAHDSATSEGTAKAASSKPKVEFITNEPIFKISEHPMLRSGLILAGGNAGWQGKQTLEGKEDGVLTAYEISQMNLSNTELVVLSACETGLGDIQGNEGVYGLQRAFKIAGAKYLIMSLWQIPDRETKEFMVSFYKNWLQKKKTIPDAFRQTQKEMRERFINPFSWAGFVLVE